MEAPIQSTSGSDGDRELHCAWSGTTTFFISTANLSDNEYSPGTPLPEDERWSEDDHPRKPHYIEESEQEPPTTTTSPGDTTMGGTRSHGLTTRVSAFHDSYKPS